VGQVLLIRSNAPIPRKAEAYATVLGPCRKREKRASHKENKLTIWKIAGELILNINCERLKGELSSHLRSEMQTPTPAVYNEVAFTFSATY